MTTLVCPVCGAQMQPDGNAWDCPRSQMDKGSAYEPHLFNPFTREKTKIRVRDARTTVEANRMRA